jgi:hypothetical protein
MTPTSDLHRIVFLLGAGASKEAGCQLSSEMLRSLKYSINALAASDPFGSYQEAFAEIYQFILASLKYQSTMKGDTVGESAYLNIEDFVMVLRQLIDKEFIIPYPLIGNWNDRILKWELRSGGVFQRFKEFITLQLVAPWTAFDHGKATSLLQPIRSFLTTSDDVKLNVFSLNYDLVFESVFNSETSRILDNGFSERTVADRKLEYWAGDFNGEHSSAKINLFKLHGSLDWEYNEGSEEISIKDDPNDGREPLMIFGSYSKMLSFDPFLFILSTFRARLEEATVCVVIGYSFHDKYINNLLIQQLSRNTDLDVPKRLLVVSPGLEKKTAPEVAEELRSIQESKSISDVINFTQLSPERIRLIPKPASQFYSEFFADGARLLQEELRNADRGEQMFG